MSAVSPPVRPIESCSVESRESPRGCPRARPLLLIGSGVLILAILAVRLSVSAGLPSLLVYLGSVCCSATPASAVPFDDADLALALGFSALVLILAEGGLSHEVGAHPTRRWASGCCSPRSARRSACSSSACGAHYLLDLDWELAFLLAAVMTPTDAAAVFSVLRAVPLKHRVTGTLEVESGSTMRRSSSWSWRSAPATSPTRARGRSPA